MILSLLLIFPFTVFFISCTSVTITVYVLPWSLALTFLITARHAELNLGFLIVIEKGY